MSPARLSLLWGRAQEFSFTAQLDRPAQRSLKRHSLAVFGARVVSKPSMIVPSQLQPKEARARCLARAQSRSQA